MAEKTSDDMRYFFRQDEQLTFLEQYLSHAEKVDYKKGSTIIPSCYTVDYLYYLHKGVAYHSILTPNGKERIIRVLMSPSLCAETLFFLKRDSDSSEQITAKTACTFYRFERSFVEEVLMQNTSFNHTIIDWLCTLTVNANIQVADDLVKDPRYRVCKFIYKYVLEYGKRLDNGNYLCTGKLSHYDISKYIGINRVSVSTVMRNLELENLMRKTNDEIEILDMEYFEDMCDLPFQCI